MKGLKILIFALIVFVGQSCTRNDGDIGPIWGMWRVSSMEINGAEVEDYSGTLYFCFQSSVHVQKYINEETHGKTEGYASWKYVGDDILVNFSGVKEGGHIPLAISGMQVGDNLVEVLYFKDDKMNLRYETPEGVVYTYYLIKW